ncbi:unnamed protein product [Rotaria sp. Silwood1]|nr:unnamed protein product [Rotaria sp. Silwood1]CAF4808884.1 unnamed protein product [Rotaria sp. Silwood1]
MSIDSTASSSPPPRLSLLKNRVSISSRSNKPLDSQVSHSEQYLERQPIKSPRKDRHYQQRPPLRVRAISTTDDASPDTPVESTYMPELLNKLDTRRDKRSSEPKTSVEKDHHASLEHRNSIAQIHFSSFLPHAFRNPKHHQKSIIKDEANTNNPTLNKTDKFVSTSSIQFTDTVAMKADPTLRPRSPTAPVHVSRFIPSNSNERFPLSTTEDSISSSFILDENLSEPRSSELFIFESHTSLCVSKIYRDNFFDYFHINYSGEFDDEGPFIASLRCINQKTAMTDICEARVIIRTQYRNYDVSEIFDSKNENSILRVLLNKARLPPVHTYGPVGDPKANEKIYLFDKQNDERYNCKIGVIYQHFNQTNEQDIFNNENPLNDMWDFLDRISKRIYLKGFQKYRGDLDTKNGSHGEYSYYAEYENHEIMFNIAPLVPSTNAEEKCTIRKGLIGNAFVCIVFQEPGANFSPDFITGRVTQIYITVQPSMKDEKLHYKIGVWRRNDITGVIDPPGGILLYDTSFASYFLTLLLNAVDVAIKSPSLRSRVYEQRQRLKLEELKKLMYLFSIGPIPEFGSEMDSFHYITDGRPYARSESVSSNTTVTANDNASSNAGRISPTSSKKKAFSKKFFGVFASRSGSISSSSTPSNSAYTDPISPGSQTLPVSDASLTFGRTSIPVQRETVQRSRSTKTNHAPVPSTRSSNINTLTHPSMSLNNSISDNSTQANLINTYALGIAPRNRSNSSPEDAVNTNKPQRIPVPTIVEAFIPTSSEDDDTEEYSGDEV